MATIKQQSKSKTIQVSVVLAGIFSILPAFGVNIPPEAVAGVMAVASWIMRLVTKTPVGDK